MWVSSTSGYSWDILVTTSFQSCDVSKTLDFSTEQSFFLRFWASLKATCAILVTCEEGTHLHRAAHFEH